MSAPYTDIGTAICSQLLDSYAQAITNAGLEQPKYASEFAGVGVAIADACEGLAWTRVGTMFPTDGSGAPFTQVRADWSIVAWAYPIECGILWCHQNITEDGGYIEPGEEAGYAARDDNYRMAWADAIANLFPEALKSGANDPLRDALMGQTIRGWMPVGPDGGYSGGIMATTVIAAALAICPT